MAHDEDVSIETTLDCTCVPPTTWTSHVGIIIIIIVFVIIIVLIIIIIIIIIIIRAPSLSPWAANSR